MVLGFLGTALRAAAADPLSLAECYALALGRSESVGISREDVQRAEGLYEQARSGLRPRVGFQATQRIQDVTGVSAPGPDSNATRRSRPESSFYIRQALFSGFREFAALSEQKALRRAREADVLRAKRALYEDTANVYYAAVEADARLTSLTALRKAAEERRDELQRRIAVGRSRESELLSSLAQLAVIESDAAAAEGQRAAAAEALRALLGRPVEALREETAPAAPPDPLERYWETLPRRPDVWAAEAEAEAARQAERVARGGFWPTLGVEGNYYTERTGVNEPINWDVLVALDVPLWSGGQYRGARNAAAAEARAARWRAQDARRRAEEEIRTRHAALRSAVAQRDRLAQAVSWAERSYRLQQREYRLGLVNNLEVVAALNNWEETRLQHDTARLQAQLASVLLAAAAGRLPEVP